MRISSAGLTILLLTGCGERQPEMTEQAQPTPSVEVTSGEDIACAIGTAAVVARCSVERQATPDGVAVTIRHPDGGFRRLRQTAAGYTAADGAEPLRSQPDGNGVMVTIGDARYRLPAP